MQILNEIWVSSALQRDINITYEYWDRGNYAHNSLHYSIQNFL